VDRIDLIEIPSSSAEFVRVEVGIRPDEDITTGQAFMCKVISGANDPDVGDYVAATWEDNVAPYHMLGLKGPHAEGRYDVWVRVLYNTEDIRRKVAVLKVT
jgi:hypothetical protein